MMPPAPDVEFPKNIFQLVYRNSRAVNFVAALRREHNGKLCLCLLGWMSKGDKNEPSRDARKAEQKLFNDSHSTGLCSGESAIPARS